MSTSLYPRTRSNPNIRVSRSSSIWPLVVSGREIDLRSELSHILYGYGDEIAKGQLGILRRARIDDDGYVVKCPCFDEKTREPDKDSPCEICGGLGYLWDEEWITYYKMLIASNEGMARKNKPQLPGTSNVPYAFFYVEYDIAPSNYDKIIEVYRDSEGDPDEPFHRKDIYSIATAEPYRSDNGRIEYWRIACPLDSVVSVWQESMWSED